MVNNTLRAIPPTLQQVVQAGSIGSHGNIPPLPTAGLPITAINAPTNVGTVSRPGIGVKPIATPILSKYGIQGYPANPGIVIKPVGARPVAPIAIPTNHWSQT